MSDEGQVAADTEVGEAAMEQRAAELEDEAQALETEADGM